VQFAKDLQWPPDGRCLGENLGLRVALVRGGDDGNRPDLAMLGVEHDALTEGLEVLLGERHRRMGDLENLAIGQAPSAVMPAKYCSMSATVTWSLATATTSR